MASIFQASKFHERRDERCLNGSTQEVLYGVKPEAVCRYPRTVGVVVVYRESLDRFCRGGGMLDLAQIAIVPVNCSQELNYNAPPVRGNSICRLYCVNRQNGYKRRRGEEAGWKTAGKKRRLLRRGDRSKGFVGADHLLFLLFFLFLLLHRLFRLFPCGRVDYWDSRLASRSVNGS